MTDLAYLHANARDMKVDPTILQVDLSYQRDPSRELVDKIQGEYDEVAAGVILVADRGERPEKGKVKGGLFIVNGQHRTLAAIGLNVKRVDARVIDLSGEKDPGAVEAMLRLRTNVRLPDRSLERFKAQLRSGDEQSIAIQKLLARYDTEINHVANGEFGINCVAAIETLYAYDDGSLLKDTLDLMRDVYGEIRGPAAAASLFKGTAWFIEAHPNGINRDRLVERMQTMSIVQLNARARTHASVMGKTLWFNIYRTIVELYNDKLTQGQRLEWVSRGANRLSASHGSAFPS
jgi:hypothetical protein